MTTTLCKSSKINFRLFIILVFLIETKLLYLINNHLYNSLLLGYQIQFEKFLQRHLLNIYFLFQQFVDDTPVALLNGWACHTGEHGEDLLEGGELLLHRLPQRVLRQSVLEHDVHLFEVAHVLVDVCCVQLRQLQLVPAGGEVFPFLPSGPDQLLQADLAQDFSELVVEVV